MKILRNAPFPRLGFASLLAFAVLTSACSTQLALAPADPAPPCFRGTILAASDADQIGTAYANGVLNKVSGVEDSLTILRFDSLGQPRLVRLSASNSVISWPAIIAASPDGRWAYVAETRGPFTLPVQEVKSVWEDMPPGQRMSVVDVDKGELVQSLPLGLNLGSASVNASGDLLVSSSAEPGREIVLAILQEGLIDSVLFFPCDALRQVAENPDPNGRGVKLAVFSPAGDVIAVNVSNQSVVFYEVERGAGGLSLRQVGEPLAVARSWSVGNWTPDGRFFIITDVNWGPSPLFGATLNGRGSLASLRFDPAGRHAIVSRVEVGLSPEGFDLSPDGKLAVVANMRRTYLPKGLPYSLFGARAQASLSLLRVDPATGTMELLGSELGFEGELPEDAIFDADGKAVAVAVYHARHEQQPRQGFIEFWRVEGERLVRTQTRVPLARGVHTLLRVP